MIEPVVPPATQASADETQHAELVINPLTVLHLLRSAGGGMAAQLVLYGQLASVEWALEKKRLFRTLTTGLFAFAFLLCLLSLTAVLVLALSWDTHYRILAVVFLMLVAGIALTLTWRHFLLLQAQGQQAFFALREEFSADMVLLKAALTKDKS